ncbi:MAG: TetR family transcriptional regulator [Mycobacteriales bacterium]
MVPSKGELTRARIVDCALRLFAEQGYEATTMRAIAQAAGVSTGNAYQYFAGKDHLVLAFYERSQLEHSDAAAGALASSRDFESRLHAAITTRIDTMQPYRAFASSFFRTAADASSSLSPFSDESGPARAMSTAIYAEVLSGSTLKVPAGLREELPGLLWLYQMGVVLFWVHDRSPGSRRTYLLVDRTVPLVVRLVGLARYRLLRSLLDDVLALVRDLRGAA